MRSCLALAVVFVGCGALYACGSAEAAGQGQDDAGETGDTAAPPPPSYSDAGTTGGRDDAATAVDGALAIDAAGSVKVRWSKACWEVVAGKRYQSMHFDVTTPAPATVVATLFLTTSCDPSKGTVVNNDVATVPSGSYAYWFNTHPDETGTSAIWSIADKSSGCVDYQHAPDCH